MSATTTRCRRLIGIRRSATGRSGRAILRPASWRAPPTPLHGLEAWWPARRGHQVFPRPAGVRRCQPLEVLREPGLAIGRRRVPGRFQQAAGHRGDDLSLRKGARQREWHIPEAGFLTVPIEVEEQHLDGPGEYPPMRGWNEFDEGRPFAARRSLLTATRTAGYFTAPRGDPRKADTPVPIPHSGSRWLRSVADRAGRRALPDGQISLPAGYGRAHGQGGWGFLPPRAGRARAGPELAAIVAEPESAVAVSRLGGRRNGRERIREPWCPAPLPERGSRRGRTGERVPRGHEPCGGSRGTDRHAGRGTPSSRP